MISESGRLLAACPRRFCKTRQRLCSLDIVFRLCIDRSVVVPGPRLFSSLCCLLLSLPFPCNLLCYETKYLQCGGFVPVLRLSCVIVLEQDVCEMPERQYVQVGSFVEPFTEVGERLDVYFLASKT